MRTRPTASPTRRRRRTARRMHGHATPTSTGRSSGRGPDVAGRGGGGPRIPIRRRRRRQRPRRHRPPRPRRGCGGGARCRSGRDAAAGTGAASTIRPAPAAAMTAGRGRRAAAEAAASADRALAAQAASRRSSATNAAPSAIECFGWASTATGRPVASRTISATSGMREVPPTRRTRSTPSNPSPALLTARPSAPIVSVIRGRIISSNSSRVRRTSVWSPGRTTSIVVSVSDDRASFARRHSSRSRAMAASVAGSVGSTATPDVRTTAMTRVNIASSKSMPPSRSIPSGRPSCSNPASVLRRIVASNVPPPKS